MHESQRDGRCIPRSTSRGFGRTDLRGFPYRKSFISLLSLYYFTTSQFHSLRLLKRSHLHFFCVSMLCMWSIFMGGKIYRGVIDRVHTLNVAGVGLHFLHVVCLKNKELSWTKFDDVKTELWNTDLLIKNNILVEILIENCLTPGIVCWKGRNTNQLSE